MDCVGPDAQPPQVTISQGTGQQDPTNRSPIHFTATFSEPVTGFTADDVVLTGTAPGPLTVVVKPVDSRTFDVAVSGLTGGGTVIVTVAAGAAVDAAGNPSLAAAGDGQQRPV